MQIFKTFLYPSIALLLTGCASVSISDEKISRHSSKSSPSYIVQVDNAFSVHEDTKLADAIATNLVQTLESFDTKAFWTRDPIHAWKNTEHHRVHIVITRQTRGSRILRSLVGWGAGGTKLETHSTITPPREKNPTSKITTSGGSNAMPGAVFTDPVLFLPSAAILAGTTGLTFDAKRTAQTLGHAILEKHVGISTAPAPKRSSDHWSSKLLPPLRETTKNNQ